MLGTSIGSSLLMHKQMGDPRRDLHLLPEFIPLTQYGQLPQESEGQLPICIRPFRQDRRRCKQIQLRAACSCQLHWEPAFSSRRFVAGRPAVSHYFRRDGPWLDGLEVSLHGRVREPVKNRTFECANAEEIDTARVVLAAKGATTESTFGSSRLVLPL